MAEGMIYKALSGFYYLWDHGREVCCKARGKFRKDGVTPLVGDRVTYSLSGASGTIDEILPRKNEFIRPPVANVDCMVLIVSTTIPAIDPYLLDRMIFIAELNGCEPIIVFNKCDEGVDEDMVSLYEKAGFTVICTSAEKGDGIETLRKAISGRVCAFSGNSGVGKSSILNRLCPSLSLPTGDVSEKLGRGRHTTRHVELFPLDDGTMVADTPGFSSFEIDMMDLKHDTDVAGAFREFAPYLGNCRYRDCAHVKEDGCGILQAVQEGNISPSRHESYIRIKEYVKTIKHWQA